MGYVQGMCDLLAPLMVILDDGEKSYDFISPDTDGKWPQWSSQNWSQYASYKKRNYKYTSCLHYKCNSSHMWLQAWSLVVHQSNIIHKAAGAQMVEQLSTDWKIGGSIPDPCSQHVKILKPKLPLKVVTTLDGTWWGSLSQEGVNVTSKMHLGVSRCEKHYINTTYHLQGQFAV